ncbi:hypothetical protein ZIOFF_054614 [Zingiber officinale]|uniref:Uncharacterized protein n=1 Tax=Zingiber officinale TaxID=94328 RepID=A0A8J5F9Z4_ZINOF|nr:hypothetical protein ZIOFF_054614 [Zingiber officinale]
MNPIVVNEIDSEDGWITEKEGPVLPVTTKWVEDDELFESDPIVSVSSAIFESLFDSLWTALANEVEANFFTKEQVDQLLKLLKSNPTFGIPSGSLAQPSIAELGVMNMTTILGSVAVLFMILYIWNYGSKLKYETEVKHKLSMDLMLDLGCNLVPVVPQTERFLFRRVCPKSYSMFRCIARYGYKDVHKENHQTFEQILIESLEKFIRGEGQERSDRSR